MENKMGLSTYDACTISRYIFRGVNSNIDDEEFEKFKNLFVKNSLTLFPHQKF